ncbi:tetratricopeptide repeat protein [Maricaulis sp. D1M11]|uniref:tetratricopeptide repeat protein n=1 Tax=Maricaulis sp. D1M11 TaxID=3076117 RepID=UPI0039B42B85
MTLQTTPSEQLLRFLSYLETDPANANLVADTVRLALQEGQLDHAEQAFVGLAGEALPLELMDLQGQLALARGEYPAAAALFQAVIDQVPDNPAVRFNLAWVRTHLADLDGADALLTAQVTAQIPQAAALKVQLLHTSGDYDAAIAIATDSLERHPDHPGLNAIVSVLAMDTEHLELARASALMAGPHPDALTTLGTLALGRQDVDDARARFEDVLSVQPRAPRALLGRGMAALLSGDYDQAIRDIDRGAEIFDRHIGSWVAAGWAHLIAGDLTTARARFETALALDHNFGETHGSLGVVALAQGRSEDARQLIRTGGRLDPQSFSVALGSAMINALDGHEDRAQAILETALTTPVTPDGETLLSAIVRLGAKS